MTNRSIRQNLLPGLIAPILRGLTFDGQKGKLVLFVDDPPLQKKLVDRYSGQIFKISIPINKPEIEFINELTVIYHHYQKQSNQPPRIIRIEDVGLFLIGESYSDLQDILQGKAITEFSVSINDRNSIVKNKISVVTGGAQGLGEGLVRELVNAGSLVFIVDLNLEKAAQLSDELNHQFNRTVSFPVKVNVTDEASVQAMVSQIVRSAGGIDLFINNAGVLKAGSVKEMTADDFNFVTQVNYQAYFLCTKHVSKVMSLQNKVCGRYFTDIIQINSKSGLVGSNKNGAYAGSKFGGIGLTQSFALELIEDNIKVNSICPGNYYEGPLWSDPVNGLFVQYLKVGKVAGAKTIADIKKYYESMVPLKRGCLGEDIIKAVFYLVDQKYETGQALPVTGGQIMLN